jgi:nicotinamide-nucleotide amidase
VIGPRGVDGVAGNRPPVPLQRPGHAGEGAAGADELAEGVDLAARLPPQLLAGTVLVGADIAGEVELIGPEGVPLHRHGRRHCLHPRQVVAGDVASRRPGRLVDEHHLGTEGLHHGGALVGVAARHDGDEGVAGDGAHDGEAGSRVAAGELHHRLARPEPAVAGGVLDHAPGDAVLLRPTGVQVVELGQDATRAGMQPPQLDQRGGADRVQHRIEDGRHQPSMGTGPTLPAMFEPDLTDRAERAAALLKSRGDTIGVAEGACGGLVAASLLSVPGASAYFVGGAVVYTFAAKEGLLGDVIETPPGLRGASEPFARYLARAIRTRLGTTWGIGEGGAAGPPNRYGDPAGHAWLAVDGPTEATRHLLTGLDDRRANMVAFTVAALDLLVEQLSI